MGEDYQGNREDGEDAEMARKANVLMVGAGGEDPLLVGTRLRRRLRLMQPWTSVPCFPSDPGSLAPPSIFREPIQRVQMKSLPRGARGLAVVTSAAS